MLGEVLAGQVVRSSDNTVGVDQVADPAGQAELVVVLALLAFGFVGSTDLVALVADQRIREPLALGEGLLVLDGVERRTDDDRVGGFEVWGSITEPSTFDRSTGCRGLRVPPEGHPPAAEVAK